MTAMRRTALHDAHRHLGASFVEYAGWSMPVRYTSDIEEHRAVRTAAGLFDLSHMGQIELEGPQAAEALDVALVGWLSKLVAGRAKYTMMCDESGGVIDDLVVYRTGDQQFLVVANASNHSAVLAQLTRRAAPFDARVTDLSETGSIIAIQGPLSLQVLRLVTSAPIDQLKQYSIIRDEICHVPLRIARTGYTGEDGFEIYVNSREASGIWTTLLEAGDSRGLRPAGLACRDTLRLEAGMPLYGHELDIRSTPFEAGLGRIVAFDKPVDFVGRAALWLCSTHVRDRVLVGLELDGPRVAREGQAVLHSTTGEVVGTVTSGAPSPTLGHPIAMAYVHSRVSTLGSVLIVDVRGRQESARVVTLPFYRRTS